MSARTREELLDDLADLRRETAEHLEGIDEEDFLHDKTRQRAVERTLELIGEVSNRLGDARPAIDVPWDQIARFRIGLAHAYHQVEPRIVYETATRDVPRLRRALERAAKR